MTPPYPHHHGVASAGTAATSSITTTAAASSTSISSTNKALMWNTELCDSLRLAWFAPADDLQYHPTVLQWTFVGVQW